VREENIFLTGFPLPKELTGGPEAGVIRHDLPPRLCNLDPSGIFRNKYQSTLKENFGVNMFKCFVKNHPLTLVFAVGGAGAQRNLGIEILKSLAGKIRQEKINLILVAGARREVANFFNAEVRSLRLTKFLGKFVNVVYHANKWEYFKTLSNILHTADILWTKPSEMSFYTGLGLPIIMAPPIGSQEEFNRIWLKTVGGGVTQNDPRYTDEWLFDWINSGGLARMAWNGFIEAPTHGTFRIEQIITGKPYKLAKLPLIV